MAYNDGEAAILARVQAVAGFGAFNASRGDWKPLGSGRSDHYAILRPGEFDLSYPAFRMTRAAYNTVIEVWQRYVDDAETRTALYGHIDALLSALVLWPHMGEPGIIEDANIHGSGEPALMRAAGGDGPTWLRWDLRIEWSETTEIVFNE